jgi:hypothetical protein
MFELCFTCSLFGGASWLAARPALAEIVGAACSVSSGAR